MIRRLAGAAVVLGAVIVSVAIGSCGSSSGNDDTSDERLTACDLTTTAEVEEALDGDVSSPEAADDAANDTLAGRSGCAWSRRDGSAAVLVELVRTSDMSPAVRRTGFSASARFAAARSRAEGGTRSEIGGQAFWVEDESQLHLLTDDTYAVFEVAVTPSSRAQPIATQLARAGLTRIEQWPEAD